MVDASKEIGTALVLGGGGPVGISWMTGLVIGLREAGFDLSLAERFVGTSAGAVVGAVLASGGDPARLADPMTVDAPSFEVDLSLVTEIFTVLARRDQDRKSLIRQVGELAKSADTGDPAVHVKRMESLTGLTGWPDRDLRLTAVDIGTGEFQVWTRDGAATLAEALACSTCVPGVFPPIPIQGHTYVDGGLRSGINADQAAGADLIVILEPLAHMFPRTPSDANLGGATEVSVVPDEAAIAAFGLDVFSPAALTPAYEAGLRQSAEVAHRLKDLWPTA